MHDWVCDVFILFVDRLIYVCTHIGSHMLTPSPTHSPTSSLPHLSIHAYIYFARLPRSQYATDAQLENCLVDRPPSTFNSSLFRPDFVAAYASAAAAHSDPQAILAAIPRGCKEVQPFFTNLVALNGVQIVTAIVMLFALAASIALSMCRFQGYTVEGFLPDDGEGSVGSHYEML